jgi:hypothetical protein
MISLPATQHLVPGRRMTASRERGEGWWLLSFDAGAEPGLWEPVCIGARRDGACDVGVVFGDSEAACAWRSIII